MVLGVQKLDTKGVPVVSAGVANAAESAGARVLRDPPFPHFGLVHGVHGVEERPGSRLSRHLSHQGLFTRFQKYTPRHSCAAIGKKNTNGWSSIGGKKTKKKHPNPK